MKDNNINIDTINNNNSKQIMMMKKKKDKRSLDYIMRTMVAGGIAGCAAKTAIAPLDRVKILFQTSNPHFSKYSGSFWGVFHAANTIFNDNGLRGLFQGHSATLLRIFPYAAIKFMSYEQYKRVLMPTHESETPLRSLLAGSMAGVTSVFFSYPLELIRVRLAFNTTGHTNLASTCRSIFNEPNPYFSSPLSTTTYFSAKNASSSTSASASLPSFSLTGSIGGIMNFYRGFFPTIWGMIPYAGVSFLTYDTLKQVFSTDPLLIPYTTVRTSPSPSTTRSTSIDDDTNSLPPPPRPKLRSWALLTCGAISGAIAQTSSYPFEIVRRNMQVAGLLHSNSSVSSTPTTPTTTTTTPFHSTLSTAKYIYNQRGLRGFFVGLSIGYLKVTPMFAISFYVYELMKGKLEID